MKRIKYALLGCFVTMFALTACNEDESPSTDTEKATTHKVAIVMPASEQSRWERIVSWVLENMDAAQQGLPEKVKLEIEWQDEEASGWEAFVEQVAEDDSYVAIVGPHSSVNARKAAQLCNKKQKTLILPIATSTEFQRIYASSNYVWNLSQSDITQCELLLTQAKLSERRKVSLLTSDDDYGQSFSDWFAFQAIELGLEVEDMVVYRSESEIREMVRKQYGKERKYVHALIFAPGNEKDALVFDDELERLRKETTGYFEFPLLLCSDMMNSSYLLSHLKYPEYEGLAPSAAPESGFNSIYQAKFGEEPLSGEAHLYDAVSLLAYALTHQKVHQIGNLNESILAIVEGEASWNGSWLKDDIREVFSMLQSGIAVDLNGVTGDWTFDERTHASVLNTTYSHWLLKEGVYTTLEYLSTDGSAHTISSTQAWEWQNSHQMYFDPNQKDVSYPDLDKRWAVVIGTSDNWANYRHQADALAMYQVLKRHGYDDDHIVLIIEDNIAYHKNNLYQGVVKVRPDGENVYKGTKVDYKLSDVSLNDLADIMQGEASDKLPHVIEADSDDNVMVFWCGHGHQNTLAWGSNATVYGKDVRSIIEGMNYRKIFFALDACYSGTIGEACEGLQGVLVMTAANAYEPSKADMKDPEMGIWLSNGFTRAFQEAVDEKPDIKMSDLYYKLARQTVGSHATVYNFTSYGNIYSNTMEEFMK